MFLTLYIKPYELFQIYSEIEDYHKKILMHK